MAMVRPHKTDTLDLETLLAELDRRPFLRLHNARSVDTDMAGYNPLDLFRVTSKVGGHLQRSPGCLWRKTFQERASVDGTRLATQHIQRLFAVGK